MELAGDSFSVPGVNIQWPWSQMILTGVKTTETRNYPLPQKYLGKQMALIETPGPLGLIEAGIKRGRIAGLIRFSNCFPYRDSKHWGADFVNHRVSLSDKQFEFNPEKIKWGWIIKEVIKFDAHILAPSPRGIIFANDCRIPRESYPQYHSF